jgi:hypothetical protein
VTPFFVNPQSVSVRIDNDNPEAGRLVVVERAEDPADTRTFEFPMNARELRRLRDDIDLLLSTVSRHG